MKILNYNEVFRLFNNETLSIDFDERIFLNKIPRDIVEMDQVLKDRSLQGNFITETENFAKMRELRLHNIVTPSLWHTVKGAFVCKKGEIVKLPILERVTTKDKTLFAFVELSAEMVELGFTMVGGGLINLMGQPLKDVTIVNTEKFLSKIPNDTHVVNLYLVSMT
jgi:hypothetical protein